MKTFFLILYLFVGFIPYFGASDKSAPQILYLNIINCFSIVYFIYEKTVKSQDISISEIFNKAPIISYFLFFIIALISALSVAINKIESFRILTEIYTYLISFSIIFYLVKKHKNLKKIFLYLVLIIGSIEVIAIISPYLMDLINGGVRNRSSSYSGITGNINIAAFSILIKLPFFYYAFIKSKNLFSKIYFSLIFIIIGYIEFFVLQTRGAMLGFVLILFGILFNLLFKKNRNISHLSLKSLFIVFTSLSILILSDFIISKTSDSAIVGRLQTIGSQTDGSSQERLRYWSESIDYIKSNPLLGVGIGNWKLWGIKAEGENINNYIVPYHAHNDFLELAVETGLFGMLFFFFPIFLIIIILFKELFINRTKEFSLFKFVGLLSFSIYLVDASLNFPFARPIQQVFIIFLIAVYHEKYINFKISKFQFSKQLGYLASILILLQPLSLYSSVRLFNSSKDQFYFLGQFNANKFIMPIEEVEKMEMDYPNISGTTIPLKTFKAMFYLKNEEYQKAIDLYHQAKRHNPFLKINETYIAYAHFKLNNADSSKYYSKIAFETQPRNMVHYSHYQIANSLFSDTTEIRNTYLKMKRFSGDELVDKIYLLAMNGLVDKDQTERILNDVGDKILYESKDDQLVANYYVFKFGKERVIKADRLNKLGDSLFKLGQYEKAAFKFEEATKLNNLEIPYFENAANAFMQISNHTKVFEITNYIIQNFENYSGKVHYIRAVSLIEQNKLKDACQELAFSFKLGFRGAKVLQNSYCR